MRWSGRWVKFTLPPVFDKTFNFAAYSLTGQGFLDKLPRMQHDIQRFEDKLNHFVTLFARLRAENNELRQTVATKSDEVKRLGEKLDQAKTRIEALLAQLPETESERL